ncbi:cln3/battenin, putative [Pediculus humanus corporis]|uniref:Battenin n=1 Tax=Pediculus humanus subsp. corporis TaxID=121224 RepID=E0VP61_PEDHC|nr:cln3/battenin, putative [Pediculus humanus corporis]EEB15167.1 cln3/battenin, putative [Pediculus humanus corporis]
MDEKTSENSTESDSSTKNSSSASNKVKSLRTILAFWILGLCNNYIYVIMLSAAHDIIHRVEVNNLNETNLVPEENDYNRNCTQLTTGAILLADIVPTLFVKLICPFLPFLVHFRIGLAVITGILSLVLVAISESVTLAIIGICFASFNSGLGEITLLAYSTNFPLYAVASWSSGTGGAGLVGSFAYAGMTEGGLSPEVALLTSISVPILMAISFWIILEHPKEYKTFYRCKRKTETTTTTSESNKKSLSKIIKEFKEKLKYVPKLIKFMIPVGLVYYFEYLINSGLFDKFEFTNTIISKSSQFRWFNVMYQLGVFISRSSVSKIHFEKIWIMSLLQGINFIILFLEAIYGFIPNVWIMFILIFWEGLLGGAAYANTFYNMSYMVDKKYRLFALSIASVADTFGIVLSGVSAFPLHTFICNLPFEKYFFRWP